MKIVNRYWDFSVLVYVSDWRDFIGIDIDLVFPDIAGKFHSDRIIVNKRLVK